MLLGNIQRQRKKKGSDISVITDSPDTAGEIRNLLLCSIAINWLNGKWPCGRWVLTRSKCLLWVDYYRSRLAAFGLLLPVAKGCNRPETHAE